MTSFRPAVVLASLAVLALTWLAAPAQGATRLVVRGAGWGHGIGMSQYGTLGFAQQGHDYKQILRHYYTGTDLSRLSSEPTVRVLLQSSRRTVTFTGASQAGDRRLRPTSRYRVTASGLQVTLRSATGRKIASFDSPLRVIAPDGATLRLTSGPLSGSYRGAFELRPSSLGGVNVVNAVGLENYVRGVVSAESPASWPAEALKTQAVAARTYAITTKKPGIGFDHYPDTRSQVYRGVAAERPTTDAAVSETAHQVVTYNGEPVVTYFFSTSGGRTENVENVFIGGEPKPWLKSVEDPYDRVSPRHRWGPYRYTMSAARKKLGGLVKGSLRSIKVVQRGASPRIVRAEIIGSRGRTTVTGPVLRARFGLMDTWAYFTVVGTKVKPADEPRGDAGNGSGSEGDPSTGAVQAYRAASARRRGTVTGSISGMKRGTELVVERRTAAGRWSTEARTELGKGGRYSAPVARTGTYRVRAGGVTGPSVVLR